MSKTWWLVRLFKKGTYVLAENGKQQYLVQAENEKEALRLLEDHGKIDPYGPNEWRFTDISTYPRWYLSVA